MLIPTTNNLDKFEILQLSFFYISLNFILDELEPGAQNLFQKRWEKRPILINAKLIRVWNISLLFVIVLKLKN